MINIESKLLKRVFLLGGVIVLLASFFYGFYKENRKFPVETWEALLIAMQEENFEQLRKLSTERGFDNLMQSEDMESNKIILKSIGTKFADLEVEWTKIDNNTVEAKVGSPFRTNRYIFVRRFFVWKLDEWKPTW